MLGAFGFVLVKDAWAHLTTVVFKDSLAGFPGVRELAKEVNTLMNRGLLPPLPVAQQREVEDHHNVHTGHPFPLVQ